eukprot:4821741-Prymnesium_polylepis.1
MACRSVFTSGKCIDAMHGVIAARSAASADVRLLVACCSVVSHACARHSKLWPLAMRSSAFARAASSPATSISEKSPRCAANSPSLQGQAGWDASAARSACSAVPRSTSRASCTT